MEDFDVRWRQRLANYRKALLQLTRIYDRSLSRALDEIEVQALIKCFEMSYEVAWNLMKDWAEYQGNVSVSGSRDAIRWAFRAGLVTDGAGWMEMLQNRNRTAHTYNEETAIEVTGLIRDRFYGLMTEFLHKMEGMPE